MDALEVILTRRSVRQFSPKAVESSLIQKILEAGMSAPSAVNRQPWHFLVVTERKLLDQIPTVHPHSKMCLEAPAAIIVCGNPSAAYANYWVQDVSAANENILLAIRALGLGGVWLGVYPDEKRIEGLRKMFNIPDMIMPFSIIPFGYTEIEQVSKVKERFQIERIHQNSW